jgi:hypothetical protein
MTKRSHQIASRQAAISRERKKKKKSQTSENHAESSGAPVNVKVSSDTAQISTSNVSTKSSQSIQLDENRYQYVKRDLRRTIIIAVPLIVILIILAIVL